MLNPWMIVVALIIWGVSLASVGYWQHQDGVIVTEAAYAKRDNAALTAANAKIKAIEEKNRAIEQDHAVIQAVISDHYEKELQSANKKTADLIAAARSGTFRLRDPKASGIPAIGSNVSKTAAGAGGCDAARDGGFSADATEFLLALTGRCNIIRDKLAACQAVVLADRYPPKSGGGAVLGALDAMPR